MVRAINKQARCHAAATSAYPLGDCPSSTAASMLVRRHSFCCLCCHGKALSCWRRAMAQRNFRCESSVCSSTHSPCHDQHSLISTSYFLAASLVEDEPKERGVSFVCACCGCPRYPFQNKSTKKIPGYFTRVNLDLVSTAAA